MFSDTAVQVTTAVALDAATPGFDPASLIRLGAGIGLADTAMTVGINAAIGAATGYVFGAGVVVSAALGAVGGVAGSVGASYTGVPDVVGSSAGAVAVPVAFARLFRRRRY